MSSFTILVILSSLVTSKYSGRIISRNLFRADFWAGDPTKHFSVKKKGVFSEKGGGIQ